MKRETKAKIVNTFTFDRSEINHLSMEFEQLEFMESECREGLRKSGLPYLGGDVHCDLRDLYNPLVVIMTISI